jgi:hypothetical protein
MTRTPRVFPSDVFDLREGDAAIHLIVCEAEMAIGQRLTLGDLALFVLS